MKAILALEDGTVFEGRALGSTGETYGEVVFNTSMTGYQEILTDPSYKGQIVVMTYPLIGNYGINTEDVESRRVFLEGFVVREASRIYSNWRSAKGLNQYLAENNITGIEGVDTRALTKHIRVAGAMKGAISTGQTDSKSLIRKVQASRGLAGRNIVKEVLYGKKFEWNKSGKYKVVAVDCGIKFNMLRELEKLGSHIFVLPAGIEAAEILRMKPDGVLLSNGPGDPAAVKNVIGTVKKLLGKVPIFGICLGHQMVGLALGAKTYKLKFGHHGANQPVKDLRTGKIYITVQNHGFCVDEKSLNKKEIEITHINLNDGTLEGIKHKRYPLFSVQFHPEASAGPNDAKYLFGEFIEMMKGHG